MSDTACRRSRIVNLSFGIDRKDGSFVEITIRRSNGVLKISNSFLQVKIRILDMDGNPISEDIELTHGVERTLEGMPEKLKVAVLAWESCSCPDPQCDIEAVIELP